MQTDNADSAEYQLKQRNRPDRVAHPKAGAQEKVVKVISVSMKR